MQLNKHKVLVKENKVSDNKSKDFGWYSSYETLGAVDGPGLRLIIFLQGCPLNCLFCHNPETIPFSTKERKITGDEVVDLYKRNESFYKDGGGVTFSGGESMAQIDFVTETFRKLKEQGVHTCLDTAAAPMGVYDISEVEALIDVTDLFIIDIKHPDQEKSIELTGQGVEHQIGLIRLLEQKKKAYWIRHVYLPTFSDAKDEYMLNLGRMMGNLKSMKKFEILPYHIMAKNKYKDLNWNYPLEGIEPPTKENLAHGMKLIKEGMQISKDDPSQGLIVKK